MGRPIKKIHIGERGAGTSGGEGLASVTLGGTNNSTLYTAADALTISAPDLVGSVQAVGEVTVYADGALLEGVTTLTSPTGTEVNEVATYTLVAQKSSSGGGTGAQFTIAKAGGQIDYSDLTITITALGSGYLAADTIVLSGADLGGADGTNDLTITVSTFVTNGTISGTTITTVGDGYTSAPTVSAATGTQGTLSMTGVLTATNAAVIAASAYITNSDDTADIKAQKGATTYRCTTVAGTLDCTLVAKTPDTIGDMAIIATDFGGGTYWVTKLYNNTVRLTQSGAGPWEFTTGTRQVWADVAVVNYSVKITS